MPESKQPILFVVCNDYGELALAMYLLQGQPFAERTTLMLPPRLFASNSDILSGRTIAYHTADDIQQQIQERDPGFLGLLSGYLLPIHRLCDTDKLCAVLHSAKAAGWKTFTSDPFVGLLDETDPSKIVTLQSPRWSLIWSIFAAIERKRLSHLLTEMHTALNETPHVYPVGGMSSYSERNHEKRLFFHNPAFAAQNGQALPALSDGVLVAPEAQRWLFVLGDQDFVVQDTIYGNRKFRKLLIHKLHETLQAGCIPTLIACEKVITWIRQYTPLADKMELMSRCDYPKFVSLLHVAEYVFYWNATSFSCILRTLMGKPWFTFDDGHLLRGMNAEYGSRVSEWFYRGQEPPRLKFDDDMTSVKLFQATLQFYESAGRIRQGLLASHDPQSLFAALEPGRQGKSSNF